MCRIPLRVKGELLKFRCMCDDDVRMLMRETVCDDNEHVAYLSVVEHRNEISDLFIKVVLTSSKELVK